MKLFLDKNLIRTILFTINFGPKVYRFPLELHFSASVCLYELGSAISIRHIYIVLWSEYSHCFWSFSPYLIFNHDHLLNAEVPNPKEGMSPLSLLAF
jgi:hypothetical protein